MILQSKKSNALRQIILFSLIFVLLTPIQVLAASITYTSQPDFEGAINQTGADTTTTAGSLAILDISITASPAQETRSVALLVDDDASIDADIQFYLESYFSGTFTYSGDEAADDVIEFANVTQLSDVSSYDILIVHPTTTTESGNIDQDVIDAFADAGGIVIENMVGYSYQRQRDTYDLEQNFDYTISAIRDIDYDGTNIWTLDDTSPESVYKLSTIDGSVESRYCAPNTVPRSIVDVSGTLYIVDSAVDELYAIDPASLTTHDGSCASPEQGTVYDLSDLSPAPASPWGLTHDGTYFYLVDSVNDTLYQFSISGASLMQNNAWSLTLTPRVVDVPRGLGWDGTYLYFADQGTNLIYQLSTTDGSVVNAYDPYDGWGQSDVDILGVTFINGDMWLVDDEIGAKKLFNNTSYYRDTDNFEYFSRGNTSFETPSYDPKGLTYDGTYFWLVDDYSNTLYKLNATTGATESSCQTPWSRPSGLAYDSGVLYVSDWNSDTIYLLDPADCSVSSSYAAPSTSPHGLVHDGTNLWHVDSSSNTIYKLNPSTGATISSFAAPGSGVPRGLAWDGTYLWMADETDDLYYQIDTSDGSTIKTRTVVELSAEGITFKDGRLWSVDDLQDRIYDVDSTLLAQGQFNAPAGSPRGFAYDGTYIWHVDAGTDTLYKLNATTGAEVTSYAAPALDPQDVAWDGSYLWITTDADDKIYKVDSSDGSTLTSYSAPASDPVGIVYANSKLYVSDPVTNDIYEIDPADGSLDATFDAPGSAAGAMAYDGTYIWGHDTDEREIFKFELDDDDEGIVAGSVDVYTTSIQGIEFVGGELWMVDSYFDMFYDSDTITNEPEAQIAIANSYTSPYEVSDDFYFTTRNVSEGFYIQRRLGSVPETGGREILANSSRGGAVFIHEDRTAGDIFVMDLVLVNDNWEISRQTVPAATFFLNALGISPHDNGDHEDTTPTYASLSSDLNTLMSSCSEAFTRTAIGTASDGETIYSYTYGTSGKPIAFYLSGTHGNEEHAYIPQVRWMQDLCTDYLASTDRAMNMYYNYEVVFVPLLNTYGIANLTRYNANGVDINRNYDYQWSSYSSSYKGSSAFSEPETQAVRDYLQTNQSDIVFVNDSHSAMAISPGMTWGYDLGVAAPAIISDIYDIFTGQNAYRWFEEKAGTGRWLTHDRYTYHDGTKPYFGNWVSSLGIASSTNEVLGKKDVETQRMVHTSSWYKDHFDATLDALSYQYSRNVYRIDTGDASSQFTAAVTSNTTEPANTSITFKYASSSTTDEPTTWYSTYSEPSAGQYLFVEVLLQRDSYSDTTPSVEDFTVSYGSSSSGSSTVSNNYTLEKDLSNFKISPSDIEAGVQALLTWQTQGVIGIIDLFYDQDGSRSYITQNADNIGSYVWNVAENIVGSVLLTLRGHDLAQIIDEETLSLTFGDVDTEKDYTVSPGDYIRTPSFSTVYYIDENYIRHPFINSQTYFTWQEDFSAVDIVKDEVLFELTLGLPMQPKPGTVLVKIQSVPKVYVMVENQEDPFRPMLRWIETEELAIELFGDDWADYVIDLEPTQFSRFEYGSSISLTDHYVQGSDDLIRRDSVMK